MKLLTINPEKQSRRLTKKKKQKHIPEIQPVEITIQLVVYDNGKIQTVNERRDKENYS